MQCRQADSSRRDLAPEDHGRHEHRRAAPAPGRPHPLPPGRPRVRRARLRPCPPRSGETVVMRILDKVGAHAGLEDLGFAAETARTLRAADRPAERHRPGHRPDRLRQDDDALRGASNEHQPTEREDHHHRGPGRVPARRHHAGAGQREGRPDLRRRACAPSCAQDPDVILVGEIRDLETAEIAIQASLTGHLVFSTLHTNDAASAVTRLVDMGVEPFLVASRARRRAGPAPGAAALRQVQGAVRADW